MGGKSGGNEAAMARADEQARQERVRQGTTNINNTFAQFDDGYFDQQRQRYVDYAVPQLNDQYGAAQKELTFALDRAGQLNSSARAQREADLQKRNALNRQQIADQAVAYETQARNNVEGARADLVAMVNATGDAEGAASSALARSSALSQPAAYSPLNQLFVDFTDTLGKSAAAEKAWAASGGQTGSQGLGLFGARRNSVQGS